MTAGLCVCVVLAVLCTSCLGLPFSSPPVDEGQRSISSPSEGIRKNKPAANRCINITVGFHRHLFSVCVCVCGVALLESDIHTLGELQPRHSRSASQMKALPLAEDDADSRANLSELLARLISSRKGVCVCVV